MMPQLIILSSIGPAAAQFRKMRGLHIDIVIGLVQEPIDVTSFNDDYERSNMNCVTALLSIC